MVNKKKKASVKNIKYNKSKVQKIKQNVVINLTQPRTRQPRASSTSKPKPPSMPFVVSAFTPMAPPPPPPPAYPTQFSAPVTNPFMSMMTSQQAERPADRPAEQPRNNLERSRAPPEAEAPSSGGESEEERRRRILGRDVPPHPLLGGGQAKKNPMAARVEEPKPMSHADALLEAVKNPKLKKAPPKQEEEMYGGLSFADELENAVKNRKLRKTVKAKPVSPIAESKVQPQAEEKEDKVEKPVEERLGDLLGGKVAPKPEQVFQPVPVRNELTIIPKRRTGIMTMTELIEARERPADPAPLPVDRPIRDDTPPQPLQALPPQDITIYKPQDLTIYKPQLSREELRKRWIQSLQSQVIQASAQKSVLEPQREAIVEPLPVLPTTPPKAQKEVYDEDEAGQAESYKSPETLASEAQREKYLATIGRTKNPDLILMMEAEGLAHQRTFKNEDGKWVNKKMTKADMISALTQHYDKKKANEKRLLAQPKARSKTGVK